MPKHFISVEESKEIKRIGNSLSWGYRASSKKLEFLHGGNPSLSFSVDGDFIGKEVVFDTDREGTERFLGDVKIPKNPVRAALWKLGYFRGYEVDEISFETELNTGHYYRYPKEGEPVLEVRSGRTWSGHYFCQWHANWKKVTVDHVRQLAIEQDRADVLGIERTDNCTFHGVFEQCNFDCKNCRFGCHHEQTSDWAWPRMEVANYYTCRPKCDGCCATCKNKINKAGYYGQCGVMYRYVDEDLRRVGPTQFDSKMDEKLYAKYKEMREENPFVRTSEVIKAVNAELAMEA